MKQILLAALILTMALVSPSWGQEEQREPVSQKIKDVNFAQLVEELNVISEPMYQQALRFIENKKINEAVQLLNELINTTPYDPRPYALLSVIYLKVNQFDNFLKVLELAGRKRTNYNLIFEAVNVFDYIKEEPEVFQEKIYISRFKNDKKSAVSFLFDDGRRSVYTLALPVFDAFNFKATILINPKTTPPLPTSQFDGSWQDWRDASLRGHEIGNHGHSHFDLTKLSDEDLEREVNGSFATITEKLGGPPLSFAFPFDSFDARSLRKVLERHVAVRVHEYLTRFYDHIFIPSYGGEELSLETAKKFVEMAMAKRLWLIAECHEIKIEGIKSYKPMTLEFLDNHLAYLKENEKDIWVDTFSSVFLYLTQKQQASLTVLGETKTSLTFSLKSSIEEKIPLVPLTVVINTYPKKPKAAYARIKESGKTLETVIRGEKILINTSPNQEDIEVEWKYR